MIEPVELTDAEVEQWLSEPWTEPTADEWLAITVLEARRYEREQAERRAARLASIGLSPEDATGAPAGTTDSDADLGWDPAAFDAASAPEPGLGAGTGEGVPGDPAWIAGMSENDLVTEIYRADVEINRATARRARAVAGLAARRTRASDLASGEPGAAGVDSTAWVDGGGRSVLAGVSEFFAAELAVIRRTTEGKAWALARESLVLARRLPRVLDTLEGGELQAETAQGLARICAEASPKAAAAVEDRVLPGACDRPAERVRESARRVLLRVEPAALERLRRDSERKADVRVRPTEHGMAELTADLPLPRAVACRGVLDELAGLLRAGGDERPIGVLRAEALADLVLRPDRDRPQVAAKLVVHMWGSSASEGGLEPGEVGGHAISAAQCRDLLLELDAIGLRRPPGGELHVAVHDRATGDLMALATPRELEQGAFRERTRRRRRRRRGREHRSVHGSGQGAEPGAGHGSGHGSAHGVGHGSLHGSGHGAGQVTGQGQPVHHSPGLSGPAGSAGRASEEPVADGPGLRSPRAVARYRPSAEQKRFVQARDRRCRWFGCARPAEACDADHVHPHGDGGATDCVNLCCFCRHHHRLKTHARGWHFARTADGLLLIRTPSGVERVVPHPGWAYETEPDDPATEETLPADPLAAQR